MVDRVLLGFEGGSPVLKVSKPGFDVHAAAAKDCLIAAGLKCAQFFQTGTATATASQATITVNFTPQFFNPFVVVRIAGIWPAPTYYDESAGARVAGDMYVQSVTNTNFVFNTGSGYGAVQIWYGLMTGT